MQLPRVIKRDFLMDLPAYSGQIQLNLDTHILLYALSDDLTPREHVIIERYLKYFGDRALGNCEAL